MTACVHQLNIFLNPFDLVVNRLMLIADNMACDECS